MFQALVDTSDQPLLPRVEVHELPGRAAAERHVGHAGAGQDPQQGTRAQGDGVPEDAQHAQEVGSKKKYQCLI